LDGEVAFGALGGGAESEGAGAFGELPAGETEGREEAGFDERTGFGEAREAGAVGLDGAWVDKTGEDGVGFEETEGLGATDTCWPAEETEVVGCCASGFVEAAFSSGMSDCFIGGAWALAEGETVTGGASSICFFICEGKAFTGGEAPSVRAGD